MTLVKKIIDEFQKSPIALCKKIIKRPYIYIFHWYKKYILKDISTIEVDRWFRDRGDETLRLDYSLTKNSIVFDLGGHIGDFAYEIQNKYKCKVYVFEPSKVFFKICQERFDKIPNVSCFNYGLSCNDGTFFLSDDNDGSSIKKERSHNVGASVLIRKFSDVFRDMNIDRVTLLKINVEGSEYDILPHLIDTGLVSRIDNIQVQFHNFIDNSEEKRKQIIEGLAKTHKQDWCYTFVWENWSVKESLNKFSRTPVNMR